VREGEKRASNKVKQDGVRAGPDISPFKKHLCTKDETTAVFCISHACFKVLLFCYFILFWKSPTIGLHASKIKKNNNI